MNIDLSTQYYLKALDDYPYNLEFTIENLQYAVSYDPNHAPALNLMGQVYMYQLKNFSEAKKWFQKSIASDIDYPDNYRHLSSLYIWLGEYRKAEKLIDFALNRPGHNRVALLRIKGRIYEYTGQLFKSAEAIEKGMLISQNNNAISKMKEDLNRIKKKQKTMKKKAKRARKKTLKAN